LFGVGEHAHGSSGFFTNVNAFLFRRFSCSAFVAGFDSEAVLDSLSGSEEPELVGAGDFTLRAESRVRVRVDNFVMASFNSITDIGPLDVNSLLGVFDDCVVAPYNLLRKRLHCWNFLATYTSVLNVIRSRFSCVR
jgi:hypothetical protein